MSRLLKYCVLLSLLLALPAVAGESDWTVFRASREVAYTLDRQTWIPVRNGDTIPNNAWISTGPRGRVQLVRGVENIAFQPNTLAGIFTRGADDRKTDVYQQSGVLDLEIEKRARPHTTVQTPFLAAVVKGTNFRVAIGRSEAKVSVNRGLVQVSSFASGQRSEVGARQSATVNSVRGMQVSGETAVPGVVSVRPTAAVVPAMNANEIPGASVQGGVSAQSMNEEARPAPANAQNRTPRGRRHAQAQADAGNGPAAGADAGFAASASAYSSASVSGDNRPGNGRRGGWSAARAANDDDAGARRGWFGGKGRFANRANGESAADGGVAGASNGATGKAVTGKGAVSASGKNSVSGSAKGTAAAQGKGTSGSSSSAAGGSKNSSASGSKSGASTASKSSSASTGSKGSSGGSSGNGNGGSSAGSSSSSSGSSSSASSGGSSSRNGSSGGGGGHSRGGGRSW